MLGRLIFGFLLISLSSAHADFERVREERGLAPIEVLEPLCKINQNYNQIAVVNEHVKALRDAVRCGDLQRAQNISASLAIYLEDEVATTDLGICYDDRKCTQAQANNQVTKGTCSASNGKSWMRTSPTTGSCELVR